MPEKPTYVELEQLVIELQKSLQREHTEALSPDQTPSLSDNAFETHSENLEFLLKSINEFFDVSPEDNIYRLIGVRLKEIVGDAIVIINSYDQKTHVFETKAVEGLGKYFETVMKLIKKNPIGITTELNDSVISG